MTATLDKPSTKKKAEPDAQLEGVKEPTATPKPITGLKIDTPEQLRSVSKALDKRIAKLTDLAKKNRDEGKDAEATSIEREVTTIRQTLVPQLKGQGSLPFNEGETLPQAVARMFAQDFGFKVRAALAKSITPLPGEKAEDAKARQFAKYDDLVALIGNVAEVGGMLCVNLLTLTADRAYQKGLVAHGATPSAIAREALQAYELELQWNKE
jgi:hypothetical protein